MSGTHRDLQFCPLICCFAWKNQRWRLGHLCTSYSGAKHAVFPAQIHRWGLWTVKTCDFGAKHAVFLHKNRKWRRGHIEPCNCGAKVDVLNAQSHKWGRTRITSLYCSQTSSMGFSSKTATYETELQVSMGPRHHLSFCVCNTAWLAPE